LFKIFIQTNNIYFQEKAGDEVPPPLPTTPPPADELAVPAVTVQPATPVAAPAVEKVEEKVVEVVTETKEVEVSCPLSKS
jgi:hypothetical protein